MGNLCLYTTQVALHKRNTEKSSFNLPGAMNSLALMALFVIVFACTSRRVAAVSGSGVDDLNGGGAANYSEVDDLNGSEVQDPNETMTEETSLSDCDECTPCKFPAVFYGLFPCKGLQTCLDCDVFVLSAGRVTQQLWLKTNSLRCVKLYALAEATVSPEIYVHVYILRLVAIEGIRFAW